MSDHKRWRDWADELIATDPEFRAGYIEAKRQLDEAWEVTCRYGNCVIFVSPDSSVGSDQSDGWGPVDCPCKASENGCCP